MTDILWASSPYFFDQISTTICVYLSLYCFVCSNSIETCTYSSYWGICMVNTKWHKHRHTNTAVIFRHTIAHQPMNSPQALNCPLINYTDINDSFLEIPRVSTWGVTSTWTLGYKHATEFVRPLLGTEADTKL